MTVIEKLNTWFKAQIGTVETPPGSNNVIYNTKYYGHPVSGGQYMWCCVFIYMGFLECGVSSLFCNGMKTAYCPYVVDFAKKNNCWVTSGYRQGDIVLFDWNGDGVADHIGWCVGSNGASVATIEGNTSDAVKQRSHAVSAIMGAYRPKYDSNPVGSTIPKTETKPNTVSTDSDTYIVQRGDTLIGIANKFKTNYLKLADLNGLKPPYMIYEGQKLMIKGDTKPTQSVPTSEATYKVVAGDYLWAIAKKTLGDGSKWKLIADENGLKSPYIIKPGQVLKIPKL